MRHLVCHVEAALGLVSAVEIPSLGLLLDTYHMNIEEADPIKSVEGASDGMILLHVADSNRRAPGRGHVPFPRLLGAVRRLGYRGPWSVRRRKQIRSPSTRRTLTAHWKK